MLEETQTVEENEVQDQEVDSEDQVTEPVVEGDESEAEGTEIPDVDYSKTDYDDDSKHKNKVTAKQRMAELTARYYQEKKAREQEKDELTKTIEELKTKVSQVETNFTKKDIEEKSLHITNRMKDAWEQGDHDKYMELNRELMQLNFNATKTETTPPVTKPTQQQPTQQQPTVNPDKREVDAFISRNANWFGKDPKLTAYAQALEESFLTDPNNTNKEYGQILKEVEVEVKSTFPSKFPRVPDIGVGGATVGSTPKGKIDITSQEIAEAKALMGSHLNLSDEEVKAILLQNKKNGRYN